MNTITRSQFQRSFEHGIDLEAPALETGLEGTGVSLEQMRNADANRDGVIAGHGELTHAFNIIDGLDDNASGKSFRKAGDAGQVYSALLEARRPPPDFGDAIAQAARDRVASEGPNYAVLGTPTSPLVGLSGNSTPGTSRPSWLKGQNKCATFVGDSLTQAGVKAPTVTMENGSLHYARAESWPKYTNLFDQVRASKDMKVGDVIMRDDTGASGPSTAHIEIVTALHPLRTTGAHPKGVSEQLNPWLSEGRYNSTTGTWVSEDHEVFILRPKKPLD